ncbi:response regulator transcription factor [Candidatus Laterigemmans baculatus]|uniref:response regulator transcription factor n=1 Tax=Candidatus Laterigemmans baculatus TaxID=2770505 RepID=UPI0013DC3C1D|nr:response regulator [Candidatus Laterigemmans baculatus]
MAQLKSLPQPKILVADDSRTIQTIVRRTLEEAGYDVTLAADGRQAVVAARNERPQLVILDILMPEKDGYAACFEIREMGDPWKDLPIIFLTKEHTPALDRLGAEFGAYLPKPIRGDLLLSTVAALLDRTEGSAAAPLAPAV